MVDTCLHQTWHTVLTLVLCLQCHLRHLKSIELLEEARICIFNSFYMIFVMLLARCLVALHKYLVHNCPGCDATKLKKDFSCSIENPITISKLLVGKFNSHKVFSIFILQRNGFHPSSGRKRRNGRMFLLERVEGNLHVLQTRNPNDIGDLLSPTKPKHKERYSERNTHHSGDKPKPYCRSDEDELILSFELSSELGDDSDGNESGNTSGTESAQDPRHNFTVGFLG